MDKDRQRNYTQTNLPENSRCNISMTSTQDICICDSVPQAFQVSDTYKVAMMAALGAVAQHYIKFPGFDAGWQGRVEVERRSESLRFSSGIQQIFCVLNLVCNIMRESGFNHGVEWFLEIG